MDAVEYYQNYIAHFGTKGQTWGLRRHQSYETAPTRSGMVGQEVGDAAAQRGRLEKEYFDDPDAGKTMNSFEKFQQIQKMDSDSLTRALSKTRGKHVVKDHWDIDYDNGKINYNPEVEKLGTAKRLEKFRGKLMRESDNWYDAVMTGASKRYDKASKREQKILDKSTRQTADMTAKLQSFGDNPSHKQKREAMRMASKQLSIERKVAMAKAKTEKEQRAVNDAYINKMCSQAAIETMTYKDLKKERSSRGWETASMFVLPPAIAGALSATGKINRREARTQAYRDRWTYKDADGSSLIALTETGRNTAGRKPKY